MTEMGIDFFFSKVKGYVEKRREKRQVEHSWHTYYICSRKKQSSHSLLPLDEWLTQKSSFLLIVFNRIDCQKAGNLFLSHRLKRFYFPLFIDKSLLKYLLTQVNIFLTKLFEFKTAIGINIVVMAHVFLLGQSPLYILLVTIYPCCSMHLKRNHILTNDSPTNNLQHITTSFFSLAHS